MKNVVEVLLGDRKEIQVMCFGNHKCVSVMDRIDIQDGNYSRVFIKNLRREFVLHDSAKYAISEVGHLWPDTPALRMLIACFSGWITVRRSFMWGNVDEMD